MAKIGLAFGYFFTLVSLAAVACYVYFHDEVEAVKAREEVVNSDVFLPPVPAQAPAPATTNVDQPLPPATATPARNPPPSQ